MKWRRGVLSVAVIEPAAKAEADSLRGFGTVPGGVDTFDLPADGCRQRIQAERRHVRVSAAGAGTEGRQR